MKTVTQSVYRYSELSERAKEKAHDYYMEHFEFDHEATYEDATVVAGLFGLDIAVKGRKEGPAIYFSGFYSRGDGASFAGAYKYSKGALDAVMKYAPEDTKLHAIVADLQNAQRKCFYQGAAVIRTNAADQIVFAVEPRHVEDEIAQAMQQFANWIFQQLQIEYEYQTGDGYVAEYFGANDYWFYASGALVLRS